MMLFLLLVSILSSVSRSTSYDIKKLNATDIPQLYNGTWVIWVDRNEKGLKEWISWISPPPLESPEAALEEREKLEKRLKNDNITFLAHVDCRASKVLSILEVKTIPSLKYIENGKCFTFDGVLNKENVVDFLNNPKTNTRWYNYLPTTISFWTRYQLDLYFAVLDLQDYIIIEVDKALKKLRQGIKLYIPSSPLSTTKTSSADRSNDEGESDNKQKSSDEL